MHILTRKSSFESTSHALAWQTTSRSAGFVKSDLSQNVFGSGANPSDVKKLSPYFTIPADPSSGLPESSSGHSSPEASANPSVNRRCSTPGSRYSPADEPESVHAPAPAHSHISSAADLARTHGAIHTTALVAPIAGLLPSQTDPAACRNSNAPAPPHPHIPPASPPHFQPPPPLRTAAASAPQSRAIRSTHASAPPDLGPLP